MPEAEPGFLPSVDTFWKSRGPRLVTLLSATLPATPEHTHIASLEPSGFEAKAVLIFCVGSMMSSETKLSLRHSLLHPSLDKKAANV